MASGASKVCQVCGTALRGAFGRHFHFFGISRSAHNPNVCNRCDTHLQEGATVEMTVLFADLVGFTELTTRLGAEKSYEIVNAFFRMAADVLVAHDAYIDKYIGDAVMAFFNVPIQRADHATQSVMAAAAIQQGMQEVSVAVGVPMQVRVGIASGEARLGRVGATHSESFSVIGDVVNLAARLQALAEPGQIMVGAAAFSTSQLNLADLRREQVDIRGFDSAVIALRLDEQAATALARVHKSQQRKQETVGLGAVLFAILGAPCSLSIAANPILVLLGLAGSAGSGAVFINALDAAQIRIPLQVFGLVGALVNLGILQQSARRRKLAGVRLQPAEFRKVMLILVLALGTMAAVAVETWHHIAVKGLSYFEPLL
jgi:adenylate cyclase